MRLLRRILFIASFLLLSFLSILATLILRPGSSYRVEYDVRVINGFRDNSSMPLVIWCASSDEDDMGGRALQEGDDYGWSVVVTELIWGYNAAGPSLFRCTMKRDAARKTFDAFVVGADSARCWSTRKCWWLVKEDGFYFGNDEVSWQKQFPW
ncbi:hypothetical protein MLD38_036261 [Melastoma candidum]|uniref:Uncharacterized protein n=1 Tax=Melastoma candidum TaxID=119954 RepID=A0ACB9LIH4_9MYRT|nr:hypothetical protein MLD38_036261 [Melastoma candidum]